MNCGHGFDLGENLSRFNLITDIGELDGNDRAKRRLDVIRQSEVNVAIFHSNPHMLVADFDFFFFHTLLFTIGVVIGVSRPIRRYPLVRNLTSSVDSQ